MTPTELDQLALGVWNQTPACDHETEEIIEFARRYRKALLEKMEPVGYWSNDYSLLVLRLTEGNGCITPLYSLEDWK